MNYLNRLGIVGIFFLLFITSCTEKEEVINNNQVRILFSVDDFESRNASRTSVDPSNNYAITWASGDVIGIFPRKGYQEPFSIPEEQVGKSKAEFDGGYWALKDGLEYNAYYPFDKANFESAEMKTQIPVTYLGQEQNGTTCSIGSYDYTYSDWNVAEKGVVSFKFHHIGSFLVMSVPLPKTGTYTSVSLNADAKIIPTKGTYDLTATAPEFIADKSSLTTSLSLKLNNYNGVGETNAVFYMMMPPVDLSNNNLTVTLTDSDGNSYNSSLPATKFIKSKLIELTTTPIDYNSPDDDTPVVTPTECKILSMKFETKLNPGKILTRSFSVGTNRNVTLKEISEAVCTIDEENKKITLNLPYLNNRNLVPTIEVSEGCSISTENGPITSGVDKVDFSVCKQIAVGTNANKVIYEVELTNSGLPVVVINQVSGVTSTESNSEYSTASSTWYKATGTKWQPKNSDWEMTAGQDNFMIYNADGTSALTDKNGVLVNEPILASTRVRGNVTQQMPKKAFAVKMDKKHNVLDMPAHKRWVLLANWKDRTLMRNAVAFGIANVFKNTLSGGISWNPSGQFVELVYNGVHVGNYYLCEQVKIDSNRLDINDPYDMEDAYSGNPKDYGYLLECDDAYDETWKFTTANYVPFLFKDDGNQAMLDYASAFVRDLEDKLYAKNYTEAYKKMDLTSLVDFLLIQELMMNSEMKHPKSVYTYINDDKFYAGPIWDFDWNTLPVSSSYSEEGYTYTTSMLSKNKCYHKSSGYPSSPIKNSDKNYLWYPMLVKDDTFKNLAAERWNAVKGALESYVSIEIPKIKAKIADSEKINNAMWPITVVKSGSWSTNTYGMGGGACGDEGYTFEKAVSTLQTTLQTRINGMNYVSNKNWPSISYTNRSY